MTRCVFIYSSSYKHSRILIPAPDDLKSREKVCLPFSKKWPNSAKVTPKSLFLFLVGGVNVVMDITWARKAVARPMTPRRAASTSGFTTSGQHSTLP